VAFVDDYLQYLRGIPDDIHAPIVPREPNRSPNPEGRPEHKASQHARHADLTTW